MTDAWDYDETDSQQNGPKALREAYKAQKDANDKLMSRLEALEAEANRNRVADLFETQGVPRSASKFYNGDPDPDKVNAFVSEMRSTFSGASPVDTSSTAPTYSTDDQVKLQSIMQAGANGDPGSNYDVAMSKMNDPTLTTQQRLQAYAEFARISATQ